MSGRPVGEDDLQAWIDGRLDPARVAAVEAFLADNPDYARLAGQDQALRDALRRALAHKAVEPVPSHLRVGAIAHALPWRGTAVVRMAAAAIVLLALGGIAGWYARDLNVEDRAVADAVLAHRVFVSEVRHPVEVGAGEAAHLSKWLGNRLGAPVRLPDLTAQGYHLLGGRLLASGSGPAGQIMYEDEGGRRLTLYLRPEGGESVEFRFAKADEGQAFYWRDDRLTYAVVADAPRDALFEAARAAYAGIGKN